MFKRIWLKPTMPLLCVVFHQQWRVVRYVLISTEKDLTLGKIVLHAEIVAKLLHILELNVPTIQRIVLTPIQITEDLDRDCTVLSARCARHALQRFHRMSGR
jgi:hypothetical protein